MSADPVPTVRVISELFRERPGFKAAVDEGSHSIVLLATPDDLKTIRKLIETLDVPPTKR